MEIVKKHSIIPQSTTIILEANIAQLERQMLTPNRKHRITVAFNHDETPVIDSVLMCIRI